MNNDEETTLIDKHTINPDIHQKAYDSIINKRTEYFNNKEELKTPLIDSKYIPSYNSKTNTKSNSSSAGCFIISLSITTVIIWAWLIYSTIKLK